MAHVAYLEIRDLTFTYPGREEPALKNVSCRIGQGEFVLLIGETGCGKTTLIRRLRHEIAPAGELTGSVLLEGEDITGRDGVTRVGYVGQYPEENVVCGTVRGELAFGGENLGFDAGTLRRAIAETASWFGIGDWYHKDTDSLSGGQKQLLTLAAVMVTRPEILVLDEPTARLDPIAAGEFFSVLEKLNRELGVTVLLAEHRLEYVLPIADRVLFMEDGRIVSDGTPAEVCSFLTGRPLEEALPAAVRITRALGEPSPAFTVGEARSALLRKTGGNKEAAERGTEEAPAAADGEEKTGTVLEAKDLWFRYEKNLPDVLCGTALTLRRGEIFCVLGGNGTGKTTLLRVLSGLERPYRGSESVLGRRIGSYHGNSLYRGVIGLLPQDPHALFTAETVREDLETLAKAVLTGDRKAAAEEALASAGLTALADRHPFDLSGGELQQCALAKLLLSGPAILLLDEPTKGLDAVARRTLGQRLKELSRAGKSILIVTHDVEFAARFADRCGLFFDGALFGEDEPAAFFRENAVYTTAASRIARGVFPDAVLTEDVLRRIAEREA